jgi:predicted nucleic acid-binding protein
MTGTLRAFLDASVLYPVSLRGLLMRLTLARTYQARWSAKIHEEWIRAVLRDNPAIPIARLYDLRDAMDRRAGDDVVVTGYEPLIETLTLPDPDDRHVLAAAIAGEANIIITHNLRDFPEATLAAHKIQAMHPDQFIRHLIDISPAKVLEIVHDQHMSLTKPPMSMPELLALFEKIGLVETVTELRRLMAL